MVEHTPAVEDVSTLEITYYLVQIPVLNDPITPLVITVQTPFPCESTKVVPWNYSSTTYLYGQRLEDKPSEAQRSLIIQKPIEISKLVETQKLIEVQNPIKTHKPVEIQEPVVNIIGTGGMARSGLIFASAPPPPEREDPGSNSKNKEK